MTAVKGAQVVRATLFSRWAENPMMSEGGIGFAEWMTAQADVEPWTEQAIPSRAPR